MRLGRPRQDGCAGFDLKQAAIVDGHRVGVAGRARLGSVDVIARAVDHNAAGIVDSHKTGTVGITSVTNASNGGGCQGARNW